MLCWAAHGHPSLENPQSSCITGASKSARFARDRSRNGGSTNVSVLCGLLRPRSGDPPTNAMQHRPQAEAHEEEDRRAYQNRCPEAGGRQQHPDDAAGNAGHDQTAYELGKRRSASLHRPSPLRKSIGADRRSVTYHGLHHRCRDRDRVLRTYAADLIAARGTLAKPRTLCRSGQ